MLKRIFSLFTFALVLTLAVLASPVSASARTGVGIGTGKIQVDEMLKPGIIYQLPPVSIVNTGDERTTYSLGTSYFEQQPQRRPHESWFTFSPREFTLEPGEAQVVSVTLNLPVMTEPGDYFAYLEGHPVQTMKNGQTNVGIAAATKLSFAVVPGNIFDGMYYRCLSFWNVYAPWPQFVTMFLILLIALVIFKSFFHLEINLKRVNNAPSAKTSRK